LISLAMKVLIKKLFLIILQSLLLIVVCKAITEQYSLMVRQGQEKLLQFKVLVLVHHKAIKSLKVTINNF
jgi:hypothetical protein